MAVCLLSYVLSFFFHLLALVWLEIAFGKSTKELKSQKCPSAHLERKRGLGVSGDWGEPVKVEGG